MFGLDPMNRANGANGQPKDSLTTEGTACTEREIEERGGGGNREARSTLTHRFFPPFLKDAKLAAPRPHAAQIAAHIQNCQRCLRAGGAGALRRGAVDRLPLIGDQPPPLNDQPIPG